MPDLIVCESCNHGLMYHTGTGCEAQPCKCIVTKERLIEDIVEQTKLEIAVERSSAR